MTVVWVSVWLSLKGRGVVSVSLTRLLSPLPPPFCDSLFFLGSYSVFRDSSTGSPVTTTVMLGLSCGATPTHRLKPNSFFWFKQDRDRELGNLATESDSLKFFFLEAFVLLISTEFDE
jgi:hypothetical protein